ESSKAGDIGQVQAKEFKRVFGDMAPDLYEMAMASSALDLGVNFESIKAALDYARRVADESVTQGGPWYNIAKARESLVTILTFLRFSFGLSAEEFDLFSKALSVKTLHVINVIAFDETLFLQSLKEKFGITLEDLSAQSLLNNDGSAHGADFTLDVGEVGAAPVAKANDVKRKPIVGGNWKMAINSKEEALALLRGIAKYITDDKEVETVIAPSIAHMGFVSDALKDLEDSGEIRVGAIKLAAQNIAAKDKGALTGRTSISQLDDFYGVKFVIVGHSEQRRGLDGQSIAESNEIINKKTELVIGSNRIPIVCVGETADERAQGKTKTIIEEQVRESLKGIQVEKGTEIVLAYEPVWAIGTGVNATPELAQEVHSFIRGILSDMYGWEVATKIRIQYGGSVKSDNVRGYMAQADIDGALVGGASLEPISFVGIVTGAVPAKASSAIQASQGMPKNTGGIDFRKQAMASVTAYKPMGTFIGLNAKLPEMSKANLAKFDLDKVASHIESMLSAKILFDETIIMEYMAASVAKGELANRKGDVVTWLAKLGMLQEELDCCQESSPQYRQALVLVEKYATI
ncbi:triose-phosphate isomerase, partial [bacterium]